MMIENFILYNHQFMAFKFMKEYCIFCSTDFVHNASTTMDVGFIPGIAFFLLFAMFHRFIDFQFINEY